MVIKSDEKTFTYEGVGEDDNEIGRERFAAPKSALTITSEFQGPDGKFIPSKVSLSQI